MSNKFVSLTITLILILVFSQMLYSQMASPSNWMYPDGNLSATKYNKNRTELYQALDSLKVKWFSNSIRGDIQPLIGNIVNNTPIINDTNIFKYAPNEIAGVVGDTLIIFDGAGKILTKYPLRTDDETGNDIVGISALLDTASTINALENTNRTLILGFESLEAQSEDSLAVAYLGGWKNDVNDFGLIRRLALNLRYDSIYYKDYSPNYSAALKPLYARKKYYNEEYDPWESNDTAGYIVFVTANMSQPRVDMEDLGMPRPYLRGLTYFNLRRDVGFPLPDAGDNYDNRMHLAQEVSFAQPSISTFNIFSDSSNYILLPSLQAKVSNVDYIESDQEYFSTITMPESSYLFNFQLDKSGEIIDNWDGAFVIDDKVAEYINPRVRSYFVNLTDAELGYEENYVLATTEYDGINSIGRSGLFLLKYDNGLLIDEICDFYATPDEQYKLPFFADSNHFWSVGIGNVDGLKRQNDWPPYYPNNPGNEIIVTQSSREFAFAGSKLMVLRYNSNPDLTPKASPPGTYLKNFDTICTYKVQGWLAAVNDLDGDTENNKDEILLVNGSKILVLRLRDYFSIEFRSGRYFDTVFTYQFETQTITSAAIADVDGDAKNDIIVTTNKGIYIIGTPLERTIDIIFDTKNEWCFGDTATIKWRNIIQGNSEVNVIFQEYINGHPTDSLIVIANNAPNGNDTATFSFIVNNELAGKEGKIIIQDATNPIKNNDTTNILKFNKSIITNPALFDTLYVGSEFEIKGIANCADRIELYYTIDSIEWIFIADAIIEDTLTIDANNIYYNFIINANIPCNPIFNKINNKNIYGKIIFTNNAEIDSSTIFPITIKYAKIPITIDTCEQPCTARIIRWTTPDTTLNNVPLNIYYSTDAGNNLIYIGTTNMKAEKFIWYLPDTIPNNITLTIENIEFCLQIDTTLEYQNYKTKYINIVAPNPLTIPNEAQIIYKIDDDADVTIKIVDQNNHSVIELIKDQPRTSGLVYCEKWDGRMSDETSCANGMYYIILTLSNGIEEFYPIYIRN